MHGLYASIGSIDGDNDEISALVVKWHSSLPMVKGVPRDRIAMAAPESATINIWRTGQHLKYCLTCRVIEDKTARTGLLMPVIIDRLDILK